MTGKPFECKVCGCTEYTNMDEERWKNSRENTEICKCLCKDCKNIEQIRVLTPAGEKRAKRANLLI